MLSTYLPHWIKFQHAHALLIPQVVYGLEVVVGTNAGSFLRLSRIIKCMVRYVYDLRGRENGSEYAKQFLGNTFATLPLRHGLVPFYPAVKCGLPLNLYSEFVFTNSTRNPQVFGDILHEMTLRGPFYSKF
uniref:Uncharacterized protein n=1 Tax=Glossina pallidipes TaxID=7398 RepID=A0A1A9ZC23_GLOPL